MDASIIQQKIFDIRGEKVMLDFDLAILYGVETKRLNEQVKRNLSRFPPDFMFRLTEKEWEMVQKRSDGFSPMWSQNSTTSARNR
jgi:hypothetical protein